MNKTFLMIGCGAMGKAMLSRWTMQEWMASTHFSIVKPTLPEPEWNTQPLLNWYQNLAQYQHSPDVVLLAVKPQKMKEVLPEIAQRFGAAPLYITVAAGISLQAYQYLLGEEMRMIRAMPNTPVSVGAGVITMVATTSIAQEEHAYAEKLFISLGSVFWLENEALMDIATAISGSGPAYVYLFMEALTEAAIAHGLPTQLAEQLVIRTMHGATALATASHQPPHILREQVTSKGGITEAALQQFTSNDKLFSLVANAIDAALIRAEALNTASSLM